MEMRNTSKVMHNMKERDQKNVVNLIFDICIIDTNNIDNQLDAIITVF
jgi:hypothetical protein